MNAIDAIRIALKSSDMGMKRLAEMSDAPLVRRGGSSSRGERLMRLWGLRCSGFCPSPPAPLPKGEESYGVCSLPRV
jgi:hypothetical protein